MEALLQSQREKGRPPVERWNPPDRGDIGLVIDRDGVWSYRDDPITRPGLVRLLASVLRREDDGGYALVTPVERVRVAVADVPFLAVEMVRRGSGGTGGSGGGSAGIGGSGGPRDPAQACELLFRTNVDDVIVAGPAHGLRFAGDPACDGLIPYIEVRRGLEARCVRAVYYDLVAQAEETELEGRRVLAVRSGGHWFPMADMRDLEGALGDAGVGDFVCRETPDLGKSERSETVESP